MHRRVLRSGAVRPRPPARPGGTRLRLALGLATAVLLATAPVLFEAIAEHLAIAGLAVSPCVATRCTDSASPRTACTMWCT